MLVLLAIRAYMIRAFVKTLFLVIIFGLYHGLLLLPIVLSLFIGERQKQTSRHRRVVAAKAGLAESKVVGGGSPTNCPVLLPPSVTASTSLSENSTSAEVGGLKPSKLVKRTKPVNKNKPVP